MDRNDSNPGMVERQLDDAPMHADSPEREGLQGEGRGREDFERGSIDRDSLERDSMRGYSVEREGLQGEGRERESMEGREHRGGYGDDTPSGNTTGRDG